MIYADEPGHIENISFDHVSIHIVRPTAFAGRPAGPAAQRDKEGLRTIPTSGFLMSHAAGVTFRDCTRHMGPEPARLFPRTRSMPPRAPAWTPPGSPARPPIPGCPQNPSS